MATIGWELQDRFAAPTTRVGFLMPLIRVARINSVEPDPGWRP